MKQCARGHRATKGRAGIHSPVPCPQAPRRPAHPNVRSQTRSQARPPPCCARPPSEAPRDSDPTSGFRPSGSAPPQSSCSRASPQGLHGVRVRSCPRRSHGGLASIPRGFPAGYGRKPPTAGPGGYGRHHVRASPLPRDKAALRSEAFVQEPRIVPGSARTKSSLNVF